MSSDESSYGTEEQMYEVEEILAKKISKGRIKYFVKWVGYDSAQNTWEPKDHLPIGMVIEFEDNLKKSKKEKFLNKKREKPKNENNIKSANKNKDSNDDKQSLSDEKSLNNHESQGSSYAKSKVKSLRVTAPLPEKYNSLAEERETLEGCFVRDSVERIIDLKVYKGKKISCEIEWKTRSNNIKPKNTFYTYDVIYENFPKLLLDTIINTKMVVQDKEEDLIDLPNDVRDKYI